jgi:azobenzene reductase
MNVALLAGSNRQESSSTKMTRYVAKRLTALGHSARVFDLRVHPLPLYDPSGQTEPEGVRALAKLVTEAAAVVLSTPEYHGSVSGVLKNALDYLDAEHFDGKMVLCISSAGGAVGVSSLQQMQTIVRNVHGINCPEWISIGGEQRKFDAEGDPVHESVRIRVERALDVFTKLAGKLNG